MRINVGEFLSRRALLSPDLPGLICEGGRWTFRELNLRSNRLAHAMTGLGLRSGDRVGILAPNGVEHFDLFFGLAKIGAVMVPINYRLAPPELHSIFQDSGIDALVVSPEFEHALDKVEIGSIKLISTGRSGRGEPYDRLLERARDSEPLLSAGGDDELAILYTVWATSGPKGVALSHNNFFWAAVSIIATIHQIGPVFLLPLPLFHIGSLGWLPFFLHRGTRCVLTPRFDPESFPALIPKEEVTCVGMVPTMLHQVKDAPGFADADFSSLRSVLSYGDATPVELIEDYSRSGVKVRQLYGLTETAGPALVIDSEHALIKAGSCGLPFFHTRIQLVDHHGREVPPGEVGEIIIQARHVMKCYWNQPEATVNALRGGWLYTGDLARQDEDGFFYITDRKKDLIISGGENIFPGEIERVLFEHPAVSDAAVIGVRDKVWGQRIKAVLMKEAGVQVSEAELTEWCQGRIAGYKIPREFEFVDSLPRTMTGKMEKKKLRGRARKS